MATSSRAGGKRLADKADPAPEETRLDDNVTEPSNVAPGDAPADTTDPTERASTVLPQPSPTARKVGTVNSVLPYEAPDGLEDEDEDEREHRVERYPAIRPDGSRVEVEHNIDTGETRLV